MPNCVWASTSSPPALQRWCLTNQTQLTHSWQSTRRLHPLYGNSTTVPEVSKQPNPCCCGPLSMQFYPFRYVSFFTLLSVFYLEKHLRLSWFYRCSSRSPLWLQCSRLFPWWLSKLHFMYEKNLLWNTGMFGGETQHRRRALWLTIALYFQSTACGPPFQTLQIGDKRQNFPLFQARFGPWMLLTQWQVLWIIESVGKLQ